MRELRQHAMALQAENNSLREENNSLREEFDRTVARYEADLDTLNRQLYVSTSDHQRALGTIEELRCSLRIAERALSA